MRRLLVVVLLVAFSVGGCASDDGTWGGKAWYRVEKCADGRWSEHCSMLDPRKGPDRFIKW